MMWVPGIEFRMLEMVVKTFTPIFIFKVHYPIQIMLLSYYPVPGRSRPGGCALWGLKRVCVGCHRCICLPPLSIVFILICF